MALPLPRWTLLAAFCVAACSPPPPAQLGAIEARPVPAAFARTAAATPQACDARDAPARPDRYDPQALAQVLAWVYRDTAVESYCGCPFAPDGSVLEPCGYAGEEPATRIGWEAIVPPSRFGAYRRCWKQWNMGTGDNPVAIGKCAESDAEFRAMVSDLYNYHPVLEPLGHARAGNPFALAQGELRAFGSCDFESQSDMGKSAKIEPPPEVLGDLARATLYMAAHYGKGKDWKVRLSREQRELYERWAAADPVDDRERARACRIAAVQGWANPYVR